MTLMCNMLNCDLVETAVCKTLRHLETMNKHSANTFGCSFIVAPPPP
jgi:hypothetical protein